MVTLVDVNGNPLKSSTLRQKQTDGGEFLRNQQSEHPSIGVSVSRLYSIFAEAEQGNLARQADMFCDMEEKDGHLYAEMNKRRRVLMPLPWRIVPPRNATAKEKRMAAEATEWFEDLPGFKSLIFDLLDAIGHGFSPVEIEWERVENIWLPKEFHKRPQRWFQTPGVQSNDIRLIDGTAEGAPLWPMGWLLHRHRAKSGWLAESGLFRVLAWSYLFKNLSSRDLAEFLEVYGLPTRVGTYGQGASQADKMTLLRAVLDIGRHAGGIIPEGMTIDFKSAASGQVDPFQFMIEWCESVQSRVILGATLTSKADGKTSTNALGTIHNEVRHDLRDSDAEQLADTLTRELLFPMLMLNGYSDITPRRMCRFEFDTSDPADLESLANSITRLVESGAPVPLSWFHRESGIPEPKDGEPVMVPLAYSRASGVAALSQAALSAQKSGLQPLVDDAPVVMGDDVSAAMQALLTPLVDALKQGNTPDELRAMLSTQYPGLDSGELEQLVGQAIFVADLWGRINAG